MSTGRDTSNRRIIVIDDNEAIHADMRKVLNPAASDRDLDAMEAEIFGSAPADAPRAVPYEIDSAFQGQAGAEMIRAAVAAGRPYAVAFVDMRMPPGWDGLETVEKLWNLDPELQIVICTAYSDYSRDEIIARVGPNHRLLILKKPFDNAEVVQLASSLTEKWAQTRQAGLRMADLEAMVERRTADLRESEQRYALAAKGSNDGLWDWDLLRDTVYYSPRWVAMTGSLPEEIKGAPQDWLARVEAHDRHALDAAIAAHLGGTTPCLQNEHRIRKRDGSTMWALCRGIAVRDADGKPVRIAGSLSDITARKAAEEELRQGAFYDRLTGLPNRALLKGCLEKAMRRPRAPDDHYAVLFVDFDRFKLINDSLGHRAGDQLLIEIAERLTSSIAGQSTRSEGADMTVARLGGDEFVILLDYIRGIEDAIAVAERFQQRLAGAFMLENSEVFCSASIGIALGKAEYRSADDLLRAADTAMYHAKAAGKARYAIFDESMHEQAVMRLKLENDLHRAVDRGEFFLEYQPIVSLTTGLPVGLEALIRWNHPERGRIGPAEFISAAEDTGVIVPLGRWALREACRQLSDWEAGGAVGGDLSISVNLSPRQFVQLDLVDEVMRCLADAGLAPQKLKLEITESAVMDDLDTSIAILNRLRAAGVSVHLDDFGTGYSSLSCLKRLPITALKIDRSFVGQMSFSAGNPAIIHAIVTLARNLHMQVIAEGIETADQLSSFIALDCDMVQGYYFSQPLRAEDVPARLGAGAVLRRAA
jgi:diguanylate cyclase (GGDEF)-like protein/PAS domain S-box-containing protein